MSEKVLVVPTAIFREAGLFHGFSDRVDHYLPHLLRPEVLRFAPRAEAEDDPELKQLIPYVVLRHGTTLFHYQRAGGAEKRLHARRSIGIGGHICSEDGAPEEAAYFAGMWRELAEEVELPAITAERCLGLINDDRTPVGRVHLGVVHLLDLAESRVRSREEALQAGGFASLADLRAGWEAFETWSQFLLEGAWLVP
ncbi:MAG: phosphoesterase [Gemmataceae bacterium]